MSAADGVVAGSINYGSGQLDLTFTEFPEPTAVERIGALADPASELGRRVGAWAFARQIEALRREGFFDTRTGTNTVMFASAGPTCFTIP